MEREKRLCFIQRTKLKFLQLVFLSLQLEIHINISYHSIYLPILKKGIMDNQISLIWFSPERVHLKILITT